MTQLTKTTSNLLEQIKQAAGNGQISSTAVQNIIAWLTEPRYAEYADDVAAHIVEGKW
jgi:phosphoglucomutase/phosphomannomutase